MTVLTQLSVGAFATIWLLQLLGASTRPWRCGAHVARWSAALALAASTLHLGRPIHAYRALKMWRRSWLSREVLLFAAFSVRRVRLRRPRCGVSCPAAPRARRADGRCCGIGGVTASACIYRVPSRPAWNSPLTLVQFHLTAGVLGPPSPPPSAPATRAGWRRPRRPWPARSSCMLALRFFRLSASRQRRARGTARCSRRRWRRASCSRGALLALGAIACRSSGAPAVLWLALRSPPLAGEMLGRYLFFVSVVPKHMTAPYLGERGRMSLKRLLGLDTTRRALRLRASTR